MIASMTKILLATDGSPGAELALLAAADLSGRTGAELHLVHVWRYALPPTYPGMVFDDHSRTAEGEARRLLRKWEQDARVAGARGAVPHLREGRRADEITALAEELDADLVVSGSRGVGRLNRLMTGSVSEGIVRGGPCPVLVVRGTTAWPPARIVVGDDGSEPAKRAGELAAEFAGLFGARILLVRAYEKRSEPVRGRSVRYRRGLDAALPQDRRTLSRRAERLAAIGRGSTRTRLIESKPAPGVSLVARDGEGGTLLAVGSRRLGALDRAVSGSVSTHALRASEGPVLVVPSEEASAR